jgi:hypothetical protein
VEGRAPTPWRQLRDFLRLWRVAYELFHQAALGPAPPPGAAAEPARRALSPR